MKKKPSLDEFRSGGSEGAVEASAPAAAAPTVPVVAERTNKTIRIRKTFEAKLKEDAFHRSQAEGRRVTESDIIDEALEFYWAQNK
ncbi:hypothetical protein KUU78_30865 (plasmid) [Pseudomonas aeruginosa]|uniref:Uncharacterized protein n=1 Tax=Burkholderia vietnamiensis (strain G4 / LMG 22486) TaxID=269482 RepID=A4JW10_BURVG|nr:MULTISPECIES: hypothetical protein [Pseudomonadota]ABO60463.1 hypothetical protein Bcep1808_7589 [Burkholderia vietnamiensis G4]MCB4349628.1 hypothetical protein [Burkholderia vietnamiensis]MBY9629163.1 hypothetical protein [Pseudomonas aeruginosa]MBY9844560.1 hypothetical protein [Pseudomonas aeruginosa]MCO8627578.1 hypothetical protein [Burkholderia multivorans]